MASTQQGFAVVTLYLNAFSPIDTRNYGNLLHSLYAWDYVLEPWGIQGKLGLEGT